MKNRDRVWLVVGALVVDAVGALVGDKPAVARGVRALREALEGGAGAEPGASRAARYRDDRAARERVARLRAEAREREALEVLEAFRAEVRGLREDLKLIASPPPPPPRRRGNAAPAVVVEEEAAPAPAVEEEAAPAPAVEEEAAPAVVVEEEAPRARAGAASPKRAAALLGGVPAVSVSLLRGTMGGAGADAAAVVELATCAGLVVALVCPVLSLSELDEVDRAAALGVIVEWQRRGPVQYAGWAADLAAALGLPGVQYADLYRRWLASGLPEDHPGRLAWIDRRWIEAREAWSEVQP